jgi:hypothetical protein
MTSALIGDSDDDDSAAMANTEPLVPIWTRVTPAVAAAIARAAHEQKRKRADVVRLLLEPAVEQELGLKPQRRAR